MAAPARKTSPSVLDRVERGIRLRQQQLEIAEQISAQFGISAVAARVIAARGFKANTNLKNFLEPTLKEGLPAPAEMKNLEAACELVAQTIKDGGAIAICCDFDVDGLSGGSQVHHFLSTIGATSKVFVPDRFEDGYGLNEKMVRQIAQDKFQVLVTVDYGTTNAKEITLARQLGLKTVVIDHHHVGSHNPGCDVFVNPQQSDCGFADRVLSAAGLAWYFVLGLRGKLKGFSPALETLDPRSYLDLSCLGTICDMVPLIGPNRVIAKRGLELLSSSPRPGLVALRNVVGAKRQVTCYDISFGIGPRLNAAGRMVHGDVVIELLTTSDSKKAESIAQQLNKLNAERQEAEARVKEKAVQQIAKRYSTSKIPSGIAVWDGDFHTGVIGIVAQRLVEMFYRPTAVMGLDSEGIYKGSVRGIKGFSVVEALTGVGKYLVKFGGHEGAGGFSVEARRVEEFSCAWEEECARRLTDLETVPYAEADTEVGLEEISPKVVEELKRFAPFGVGNPNPQVLIKNLRVQDLRSIKSTHLKATLTDGRRYVAGMLWRQTSHPALVKGGRVDIVCRPEYSTFNGVTELQATLQAVEAL